jgi:bifunctional DNA-binding transcriptional regulator/antitoxin component of YhaV-PrlF toxin-antitoxin module
MKRCQAKGLSAIAAGLSNVRWHYFFISKDIAMTALTITSKGQITLRRELLQYLGIAPGQQVEIHKQANGVLTLQAKAPEGLEAFAGCLPAPPKALSVDEMNDIIAKSWAGQP